MSASKITVPIDGENDVLSQLLECSFRSVSFPVESLTTEVTHDVIQHKRMDRDGAKLENTGLGAYTYNVKAPFCNTIARGTMEHWPMPLYPEIKNALLTALEDRSTADFVHPEFGKRRCKCVQFSTALDPNYRSGVIVNFSLVEDTEDDDAVTITKNSLISMATRAAFDLDAAMGKLDPPPKTGLEGYSSFASFMWALKSIFDQIDLFKQQIVGMINRAISSVNQLTQSVVDCVHSLGSAPDDFTHALLKLRNNALVQDRELGYYQTRIPMTIGQISTMYLNSISDLLTLNPSLASSPVIKPYTIIRYYKV